MMTRRGSGLWAGGLANMINQFEVGSIVSSLGANSETFVGVVRDVDKKINKVMVAWNGGSPVQHDPDEVVLHPHGDLIRGRMASERRVSSLKDVDVFLGADRGWRTWATDDEAEALESGVFRWGAMNLQDLVNNGVTVSRSGSSNSVAEEKARKVLQDSDYNHVVDHGWSFVIDRSHRRVRAKTEDEAEAEETFVGDPEKHGLDKPRGGGFSIMQDLKDDLHKESLKDASDMRRVRDEDLVMEGVTNEDVKLGSRRMVAGPSDIKWGHQDSFTGQAFGSSRSATYFFGKLRQRDEDESPALHVWIGKDLRSASGRPNLTVEVDDYKEAQSKAAKLDVRFNKRVSRAASDKTAADYDEMMKGFQYIQIRSLEGPIDKIGRLEGKKFRSVEDVERALERGLDRPDIGYYKVNLYVKFDDGELKGMRYDHGLKDPSFVDYFRRYIERKVTIEASEKIAEKTYRKGDAVWYGGERGEVIGVGRISYGGLAYKVRLNDGQVVDNTHEMDPAFGAKNRSEMNQRSMLLQRHLGSEQTASDDVSWMNLRSRRAMYWCGPERTYRLTRSEQANGEACCPGCKEHMDRERYTRNDKMYRCPECGFKVPSSKVTTDRAPRVEVEVEVEVSPNDDAEVTVADERVRAAGKGPLEVGTPWDETSKWKEEARRLSPQKVSPARAKRLIRDHASPFDPSYETGMTQAEYSYVLAMWKTLPGSSSFNSTMQAIAKGRFGAEVTVASRRMVEMPIWRV